MLSIDSTYSNTQLYAGYFNGKSDFAGIADKAKGAQLIGNTTQNGIVKFSNTSGTFANTSVTIDSSNNISTSGKITIGVTPTATMDVVNKGYVEEWNDEEDEDDDE